MEQPAKPPASDTGDPWSRLHLPALIAGAAYLAWISCCMLGVMARAWDDNFMTYSYSRNLAAGRGLRFNASDAAPTEGFSSLTHVVALALTDRLGVDPLLASRALSLGCFLLVPLLVGLPLAGLLGVPAAGTIAVAVAVQTLSLLSVATVFHLQSGMETVLFAGSLAALAGWTLSELSPAAAARRPGVRRVATGGLALALVIAGRPEGPLVAVLALASIHAARRWLLPGLETRNDRGFLAVAALAAAGILALFCWRKLTFGSVLPNPYYVKAHNAIWGSSGALLPGWNETRDFGALIAPWVAVAAVLYVLAPGARNAKRALLVAGLPGAAMVLAYAGTIHEAAIHHRYGYPYLVGLLVALAGCAALLSLRFRFLPPLLVGAAVLWVQVFSPAGRNSFLGPTLWLGKGVWTLNNAWANAGKDLNRTGLGQRATIAVGAAGAIPYLSGFTAVDLAGLNDTFLSGREARSVPEVWAYVEGRRPDVFQSGLPPASPGIPEDRPDPVFDRYRYGQESRGRLPGGIAAHWDPERVRRMQRAEMAYLRDHYGFGAAYRMGTANDWLLLYVRRDSPLRERILETLGTSSLADRTSDLRPAFGTDVRRR